jgi:hypothetical protein
MDIPVTLTIPIIIAATIAIVNRIKAEVKPIKGYWWTIISALLGAGLYAISIFASGAAFTRELLPTFILIGSASAGIFDVYSKKGS